MQLRPVYYVLTSDQFLNLVNFSGNEVKCDMYNCVVLSNNKAYSFNNNIFFMSLKLSSYVSNFFSFQNLPELQEFVYVKRLIPVSIFEQILFSIQKSEPVVIGLTSHSEKIMFVTSNKVTNVSPVVIVTNSYSNDEFYKLSFYFEEHFSYNIMYLKLNVSDKKIIYDIRILPYAKAFNVHNLVSVTNHVKISNIFDFSNSNISQMYKIIEVPDYMLIFE